jgi:hypothetical protein
VAVDEYLEMIEAAAWLARLANCISDDTGGLLNRRLNNNNNNNK